MCMRDSFDAATLAQVAADIPKLNTSEYEGLMFDVEEVSGSAAELLPAFGAVFAAAKKAGLLVGVTTSHSAPYQTDTPAVAIALVKAWVADSRIDILSPQLYSSGSEPAPEFAPTASCAAAGCGWDLYRGAKAQLAPSIVDASQYEAVRAFFAANISMQTAGFIEWKQQKARDALVEAVSA